MRIITLFLSAILCSSFLSAQVITIPHGTAINVDGVANPLEWADASHINLDILGGAQTIKVLVKHDGANFYCAFLGHLESTNIRFPEVLLDVDNDRSNVWQSDDWWFHVSATDCENHGAHSVYDSCQVNRPNWTAEPNFNPGGSVTDTVEIKIPFSTLGITMATLDTIGLAFEVTNTFNSWEFWPATATLNNPSTWAYAIFQPNSVELAEHEHVDFSLYPNPTAGNVIIDYPGQVNNAQINIYNLMGERVDAIHFTNLQSAEIVIPGPAGIYHLEIRTEKGTQVQRVVKR